MSEIVNTGGGLVAQAHHPDGDVTDMVPMHGIDSRLQGKPGMPANGAYGQTYSKNLLDDTYSRDLTINSLYYDYQTGDIIDYHGGLHDLREHIIRTVYDANLMYPINSSALIRTVRFAARYFAPFVSLPVMATISTQPLHRLLPTTCITVTSCSLRC